MAAAVVAAAGLVPGALAAFVVAVAVALTRLRRNTAAKPAEQVDKARQTVAVSPCEIPT